MERKFHPKTAQTLLIWRVIVYCRYLAEIEKMATYLGGEGEITDRCD